MKTRNQLIALALTGALVITLTACGGNKGTTASTAASTSEATTTEASSDSTSTVEFSKEDLASIANTGSTEVASAPAGGVADAFGKDNYLYNAISGDALTNSIANAETSEEDSDAVEVTTEGSTETAGVLNEPTGKLGSGSYGSFSTGYTYSDRYTNSYFGIQFSLPPGWVLGNSYDLKDLNNGFTGALDDSRTQSALDNGNVVTVMVAASSDGSKFVTVDLINREVLFPGMTDVNDFLYAIANARGNSLYSSGYSNINVNIASIYALGGSNTACIDSSASYNGSSLYQKTIFSSAGPYIAMLSVTSVDYDTTTLYLTYFSQY